MKQVLVFLLTFLLCTHLASAALTIEKRDDGAVILVGAEKPAEFTLFLTNNGETEMFQIYSLLSVDIIPKERFTLVGGEKTAVKIKVIPSSTIINNNRGFFIFEYQLKSGKTGITKDTLQIKIVELKNILEVSPITINPDDDKATFTVQNIEKIALSNLTIDASSPFFEGQESLSLGPLQRKNVSIQLNKEQMKNLVAGKYDATLEFSLKEAKTLFKTDITYKERDGIATSQTKEGLIIKRVVTTKTNEGNVPLVAEISEQRDIFTRLLTSYTPRPSSSIKQGSHVIYSWQEELNPGESMQVVSTTNYTLPLIVLIILALGVFLVKLFSIRDVMLTKRVSFVKTKSGEFALKVRIHVKATKHVDNLQVIDRIPHSMKLYDQFGIRPSTIDPKTRRLIWTVPALNAGEERVFSYIMYSKIRIVGKFELPPATGVYEHDSKTHEVFSNKTYFVAETSTQEN